MMRYDLSDDEPELETLNISNDYYYLPLVNRKLAPTTLPEKEPHEKGLCIPKYGSKTIRHSLPAYDLWKAFFPTYLSEIKFKNFHRPRLRHYNNGPQAKNRFGLFCEHPIKNLSRYIFRNHKQLKNKIIQAINSRMTRDDIVSKFLLIKEARELSAKCGELYLFEYCEEFPVVLSQIGMASNVKTYKYGMNLPSNATKVTNNQMQNSYDNSRSEKEDKSVIGFEELIKTERHSKQIYYNTLKRGTKMRMIENNLYRAPLFEHESNSCDFLIIRTRNNYYIRHVNTIFTVGQMLPLAVINPPSEHFIQRFRLDLSNLYIHKLFKASDTNPPSISLDALMKLFPDYHRSVIMKRMRSCGTSGCSIKHAGRVNKDDSQYGELSLLELRNLMHPESYCLNMSMLAARQRLRELNYSESMIFPPKNHPTELEPEVLAAPWNTSKAVANAMTNKAYLDLERHLIDPTGPSREGFSCVSWVKSPTEEAQVKEMRAGNSSQIKQQQEVNASQIPFPAYKNPLRAKITLEKIKRLATYQKEAQLISTVQSRVLSADDTLTSSEEEGGFEEDSENFSESDFSQQLDDLNRLVIEGKSTNELNTEKEEDERRQMLASLRLDISMNSDKSNSQTSLSFKKPDDFNIASLKNKILVITRTYSDKDGRKHIGSEIVREPRIIALYVKKRGGNLSLSTSSGIDTNIGCSPGDPNISITSTKSDGAMLPEYTRSRSGSLGPTELCRADGTRLRISKKVLEHIRSSRRDRRQSTA